MNDSAPDQPGQQPESALRLDRITLRTSMQSVAIPLLIALGTSLALFYLSSILALLHFHNFETFFHMDPAAPATDALSRAWKPRVFSILLARQSGELSTFLLDLPSVGVPASPEARIIGQWTALGFLLVSVVYIAAFGRRAVFYILGTYACVSFGYMPGLVDRVYPWDMPALFLFVLLIALVHRQVRPWWFLPVIRLGIPFKETTIVFCLFPLLLDSLSWNRRAVWCAVAAGGCVLVKVGVDLWTQNGSMGWSMSSEDLGTGANLFLSNLGELKRVSPLLVNAGTLLGFLLLPGGGRRVQGLKLIALGFVMGNLLFGVITEFRIWFEMIPVALYAFDRVLLEQGHPGDGGL